MTKAAPLKGRWRIVETKLWDKEFLDMMEPAYIAFDGKAGGDFAFGCVTGSLHFQANLLRSYPPAQRPTLDGRNLR